MGVVPRIICDRAVALDFAALKGERAFGAFAAFEPALAVRSCTAEREAAEQTVKALGEGARPSKAAEALDKRIEAMSRKAEQDFIRCFGERAPKEPRWRAWRSWRRSCMG